MKGDNIPQTGESPGTPLQTQTNPPHRILVVEDDKSIRLLITGVLTGCGYHVDTAEDGAAGWDALQATHYDLLITDHSMPKVTGIEMIKLLRGRDAILPVIMATGAMPTEQLKRHPWLEISTVLLKPYTIAELLGAVKKVLHSTEATSSSAKRISGAAAKPGS